MKDKRLEKIRQKDPIIATYSATDLLSASKIVDETYSEHALTHISIGNISDYLQNLLKWIRINKGCAVGAIVGPFGYGKTSTAIHFWNECKKTGIISIPPISWRNLEELFNGIYGWIKYELEKSAPNLNIKLDEIYKRYQKKSLEEISRIREIPLYELDEMHESGLLVLDYQPKEIIDYLEEITNLILSAKYEGLILFLDELQITLEGYSKRDKFMNDIFILVNELLTRKGKYGIIFCMPTNTETLIADIRKDIIQRLQKCNIYIRADTIYDRKFPLELWEKYAHLYEFNEIKSDIIPKHTLDAIGQISSREDLGAGPRTVIDTLVQAVIYYDTTRQKYTPIKLIDDYIEKRIAFVAGGKLINAVLDAINIPFVQKNEKRIKTIKLLSAYPSGCTNKIIRLYNLENTVEELVKKLYGDVLIKFIEGYTLQKLLEIERPKEPHFIRLTKDFINHYSEDREHADMARESFIEYIIDDMFKERSPRQIIGWKVLKDRKISKEIILRELEGTFDHRFPNRRLNLIISSSKGAPDISEKLAKICLFFHLDWNCDREYSGNIEFEGEFDNKVLIRLNLIQCHKNDINIPYLLEFYPKDKISPIFMLSLLNYLEKNKKNIPIDEIEREMKVFTDRLFNYSTQMLFSDSLKETSKITLKFVGKKLIEEIINYICEKLYPEYDTFITSSKWEQYYKSYINALKDKRINLRIARGRISLQCSSDEMANIFGTTSILAFKTLAENIKSVIKIEEWERGYGKIRFLYHSLEEKIRNWIRLSNNRIKIKGNILPALYGVDVFDKARELGYRDKEVSTAIELLKVRKHIDYEKIKDQIYEFPISIEDRKDHLKSKLHDLSEYILELKGIVGFDEDFYKEEILKITVSINEKIENEEDCEIVQEKIYAQFRNINGFIQSKEGNISSKLSNILEEIQLIFKQGIPSLITRSIEGNVPWISDLNGLRIMIMDKYNSVFKELRNLAASINKLLEDRGSERFGLKTFIKFFNRNIELKREFKNYKEELVATNSYYTKFEDWNKLVRITNDIFSNAQTCKELYNNSLFLNELEEIFKNLEINFLEKKLEGLVDHEIFSIEIEKVGKKIEVWQRTQRETFLSEKEKYQEMLLKIQISERMVRQTFDIYDSKGSFEKLYEEIYEKIKEESINTITKDLKDFNNEILYSINILEKDLSELKGRVEKIKNEFQTIKKQFSIDTIKDFKEFDSFCNKIMQLIEHIREIEKNLRGVITREQATKDEEEILEIMKDPSGEDLKKIIIKYAEKNPKRFNLSLILKLIVSLFRKNQIIMKIIKRR